MHTYLNPVFILYLKDYICPCDEKTKKVNYAKMTNSFDTNSNLLDFLKNAFNLIDFDQNGVITYEEAIRAIKIVNKSLGTNYDASYISQMDTVIFNVILFLSFLNFLNIN